MKNTNNLIVYFIIALLPMLFSKCTITEDMSKLQTSVDSLQLYIGTPKFKTLAHFEFVDAETNLPIDDKDIKVTISGRDSAVMYNNMGTQLSEYSAKWGMLDLVVDPHKIDTSAMSTNPVEFLVTPKLDGYEANPQLVLLLNPNENSITIPMTKVSSVDTVVVDGGSTDANGEIGEDVTINFASRRILRSSSATPEFSLKFIAGTTLLSESGEKLVGAISFFKSFEGHIINPKYPSMERVNSDYFFFSNYLRFSYSIRVKSKNGKITAVDNFGKGGVILTALLPRGFINEKTSAPFKVGDHIDRWSMFLYKITMENSVKDPVSSVNGDMVVKAVLTTRQDLNSRWASYLPAGLNTTYLNFKGLVSVNPYVKCQIMSNGKPIQSTGGETYFFIKNRQTVLRSYVYSGKPTTFTIKNWNPYLSDLLTFSPSTFTTGGAGSFSQTITVSEPSIPVTDIVTVNVDLTVVNKSSRTLAFKPNANVQVGVSGLMQRYNLIDGKAQFSLKLGQVYIVRGAFGTASGEGTLSVTENGSNYVANFNLPIGSSVGQNIPFIVLKTADKTINIKYPIYVSDDTFNQLTK